MHFRFINCRVQKEYMWKQPLVSHRQPLTEGPYSIDLKECRLSVESSRFLTCGRHHIILVSSTSSEPQMG